MMMTIDTISLPMEKATSSGRLNFVSVCHAFVRRVLAWSSGSRSRQALSELTADQLRDIGLTEYEARREARRSLMVRLDGPTLPPL
jgi:uncharacterized protein YjiS (DUF1127 family)